MSQTAVLPFDARPRLHAAPAPAPAAASMEDKIAQLTKLSELQKAGILTEAEFAAQKAAILAS